MISKNMVMVIGRFCIGLHRKDFSSLWDIFFVNWNLKLIHCAIHSISVMPPNNSYSHLVNTQEYILNLIFGSYSSPYYLNLPFIFSFFASSTRNWITSACLCYYSVCYMSSHLVDLVLLDSIFLYNLLPLYNLANLLLSLCPFHFFILWCCIVL